MAVLILSLGFIGCPNPTDGDDPIVNPTVMWPIELVGTWENSGFTLGFVQGTSVTPSEFWFNGVHFSDLGSITNNTLILRDGSVLCTDYIISGGGTILEFIGCDPSFNGWWTKL